MEQGSLDCLPVFPLPGVVFFPHTILPLHIFEPRYRAMIRDCLEHAVPIAVGQPEADVMGVGRIVRHQILDEGRYNIVLEGMERVRLGDELSLCNGYRRFRTTTLDTVEAEREEVQRSLEVIRACLPQLSLRWPEPTEALEVLLGEFSSVDKLSDQVASAIFFEPALRQELLEELSASSRLESVVERILELVHAATTQSLDTH
ncbi:MAG: LON peptidase substrate-binding domain-containing protein [Myxococcota bacterium]|nr:LON peptidase substrate-binding domain-containing protein [Myxococcota bacterium]